MPRALAAFADGRLEDVLVPRVRPRCIELPGGGGTPVHLTRVYLTLDELGGLAFPVYLETWDQDLLRAAGAHLLELSRRGHRQRGAG